MPPRKDKNRVPREKRALPTAPKKDAERVAKVIARAGLGSRREVEDWIAEGRVAVNGTVLESPALTVTDADAITVDGQPLPERERTRLFLYHKPRGVVTTNRDPEGRPTLFELLPGGLPRLVSVGRLDLNSEGLLLLTNDGGLARALELPETGWLRRYRVRANGTIDQAQLDTLLKGITVEGVEYGPIEAVLDRVQGANVWITVSLREGRNREVRNVLGALGLTVGRLIRTSYGPFQLGDTPEGAVEEVRTRILRDQIGAEITAASGADFDGPILEHDMEEAPARPQSRTPVRRKREEEAVAPRRTARGQPPARGAQADDRADASPAPRGPRRRLSETHELESRGTVADRKGRTVKVERAVAPPGARPDKPARAAAPSRDRKSGPRPARPPVRDDDRRGGWQDERPRAPARGRMGERAEGERPVRPSRFSRDGGDDRSAEGRPARPPVRARSFRPDDGPERRGPRGPRRDDAPDLKGRGASGPGGRRPPREEGDFSRPQTGRTRKDERSGGYGGGGFGERRPARGEGDFSRPQTGRTRKDDRPGATGAGFGGRRPARDEGDFSRPQTGRTRKDDRPGATGGSDRGGKSFGAKPSGGRPFGERSSGGKPSGGKSFGGKSFGAGAGARKGPAKGPAAGPGKGPSRGPSKGPAKGPGGRGGRPAPRG